MEEKIILERNVRIDDWMIKEDGSLFLLEKKIFRDQNIKILVHSNENANHNRPHIYAFFNDNEYQISIDDEIEELNGKSDKHCKFIIKRYFKDSLQTFRKEWNGIVSNYKFWIDANGNYICPTT